MSKKCLVERFNVDTLTYKAESKTIDGKHYLGTLAGPAACFTEATRNGRKYTLQLWRNVEESEDFKEGMATLTILGETDHPDDRLETKIKEVAIVLRKWEIREQEGIVYCEFDILDTPNGRILKELLDYGSKIGVSSRGSGEEVNVNGETIIDPDTYYFICFDAVITPAVAQARPEIVEGREKADFKSTRLIESIEKEIAEASSAQELESIKSIVSATGIPELNSVSESINKKLELLSNGDNISSKLIKELGKSASRIEELEAELESLKKNQSADNIRMGNLKNLVKSMRSNSKSLRECLQDEKIHSSHLEEDILAMTEQSSEAEKIYESLKKECATLKEENKFLRNKNVVLESKINKSSKSIKTVLTENKKEITEKSNLYKNSRKEVTSLKSKLSESDNKVKKLERSEKQLSEQVNKQQKQLAKISNENKVYRDRYLQMKAVQCGFSSETVRSRLPENYNISDIDRVAVELSDKKDRLNKLPVAIPVSGITYSESNSAMDPELDQTIKLLESMKNHN